MQEPQLSRRRVLEGIGAAGTLSVAGCASLMKTESAFQENPGGFIPAGDQFRGDQKPVRWYAPKRVYANRDQLARIHEYYLLNARYQPSIGAFGLSVEDVSLLFHGPHHNLSIYEGTFNPQEVMDSRSRITVIDRKDEYRGSILWREQFSGMNNWVAIQDDRLVTIDQSTVWPDPLAGIKAVIDTLEGDHPSHLATQQDFDAIMGELQPGLHWWYDPVADEPPVPGVRALGSTTRFTDDEKLYNRKVFSFPEPPDPDSDRLREQVDEVIPLQLGTPSLTQQGNLLIAEAAATIDEIAAIIDEVSDA